MSNHIKNIDWSEYQTADEEEMYDIYEKVEQQSNKNNKKKLREYEGYNLDE